MSDTAARPEDLMGLSDDEYDTILEILGRTPNYTELGIFSVMWSEHCSYKSSRRHLPQVLTAYPALIAGGRVAFVERFSGTLALVGLRCLPLFLFLLCVFRDSLRLLIWYELVLLFYFISAVEAVFAYEGDWLSVAGLVLVVLQFTFCLIYIRYRGREMRQTN